MTASTQVVILAAGQSSRLHPLTLDCPKCLLLFDEEPLLLRTIRQLHSIELTSIRIVVGHLQEKIKTALRHYDIEFITNEHYATDTNTLSLHLGLTNLTQPVLLLEADVAFSDSSWNSIQPITQQNASVWFTRGTFQSHQVGGIIKSDSDGNIVDMRIVPTFATHYANYKKNLGLVYIAPEQLHPYKKILETAVNQASNGYYMNHWINHLNQLPCKEIDLYPHAAGSFNTEEELTYCRKLLSATGVNA